MKDNLSTQRSAFRNKAGRSVPWLLALPIVMFASDPTIALPSHPCFAGGDCTLSPRPFLPVKADNLLHKSGKDFHVEEISGITGTAVPIRFQLPPFSPTDYLLLSFRGLPKDFALSSGFRTSDAWLVSAHEAKDLLIMPPEDFNGSFTVEVRLLRGQNLVADRQNVKITFAKPEMPAKTASGTPQLVEERPTAALAETTAVPGTHLHSLESDATGNIKAEAEAEVIPDADTAMEVGVGAAEASSTLPPIGSEQEAFLLGLAQKMLDQNDIAAARGIYRRLAYHKSQLGTLRLAQSYDPTFLSQFRTSSSLEDLQEARRWYREAVDLGADEASHRLSALDGNSD